MSKLSKAERLKKVKQFVTTYKTKAKKEGLDVSEHVLRMGLKDYPKIPTGVMAVDQLLGGGLPGGKITTIAGPEQTAKGTLAARAVGYNQRNLDGVACWVDAENALDMHWLDKQGVNVDELLIVEKDTMENMLDKTLAIIREHLVDQVIIDSIGALLPRAEVESKKGEQRSLNDDTIGLLQRKMGQFLRLVCGPAAKTQTTIVMLGQIYQDINSYGGLELVKGGNAVKHFTHVRLMTRRGKKAESPTRKVDGKDVIAGFASYIKLGKTRQSGTQPEGSETSCPFVFDVGFDDIGFLINKAIAKGSITRNGAVFNFGEFKAQGMAKFRELVESDEKVLDALGKDVLQ